MKANTSHRRSAFTLIELLTVIAIIGILAAILIPVVGKVRESARASQCVSNLRQIGTAMHLYMSDYGVMPAARNPGGGLEAAIHYTLWTYVGFESANSFRGGQNEARATSRQANVFLCPTTWGSPTKTPNSSRIFNEASQAWYSYAPNISPSINYHGGNFNNGVDGRLAYEYLEAPSLTVAFMESSFWYMYGAWYHTRDGLIPHDGAANFLFYDNHVERLSYPDIPEFAGHTTSGYFWGGIEN